MKVLTYKNTLKNLTVKQTVKIDNKIWNSINNKNKNLRNRSFQINYISFVNNETIAHEQWHNVVLCIIEH